MLNASWYVCSGQTVNDSASGDYKNTKYPSSYYTETTSAYAGGISGSASDSCSISNCYNDGAITSWGLKRNVYNLWFKYFNINVWNVHEFKYDGIKTQAISSYVNYRGNIVGYRSSSKMLIINCYAPTIVASAVDANSSGYRIISSWFTDCRLTVSTRMDGNTYVFEWEYIEGGDYNKGGDLYSKTIVAPDTYLLESLTSQSISDIVSTNSNIWAIDNYEDGDNLKINNGKPFIKEFYWEHTSKIPNDE